MRAFVPRLQSTILPATLAGSRKPPEKHSCTPVGSAPERPASTESMSGDDGTPTPRPTPVYVAPLPSVTVFGKLWSNEPARSEEHTSELQSRLHLVCRLL